jgi:Immunity protein Imm1
MFIQVASIDDSARFSETDHVDDLTVDLVAQLARSLDGDLHTLVTLSPGGDAHMAIGGDAASGLVVYVTADNRSFHNLRTGHPSRSSPITVVAGGQPGDYDAHHVVSLEEALAAATQYAETGQLDDGLNWDLQ